MAFLSHAEEIYQLIIALAKADNILASSRGLEYICNTVNTSAFSSPRFFLLEDQRLLKDDIYPRFTYMGYSNSDGPTQDRGEITVLVNIYDKKYTVCEALRDRLKTILTKPKEPTGTSVKSLQPTRSRIGNIMYLGEKSFYNESAEIWLIQAAFKILCAFKE